MAFVMIATGATSRSRVRTLQVRPLIAVAGVAALALLASGGAVGYWLAEMPLRPEPAKVASAAPAPLAIPFTLEQVGAISARLFRLENEAAQLSRKIGVLDHAGIVAHLPPARNPAAGNEPQGATGDPFLPAGAVPPTSVRSTCSSAASSSRSPRSRAPRPSSRSRSCACRRACRSPAPS